MGVCAKIAAIGPIDPQKLPSTDVQHRPLDAFWRALTQVDSKKINLWMGLRNAVGITLPLALGVQLGQVDAGLIAATGALMVTAGDGLDSYRNRAERMIAASCVVALAVLVGSLSGGLPVSLSLLRVVWAFAAGFLVCLGPSAGDIGMISLVVFLIYGAQQLSPASAAQAGLVAFAGGLVQTGLSIALWPIRGFQPVRRTIGEFYGELARAATAPSNPDGAPPASVESTQAQEALETLSGDHRMEAERLFLLVGEAERIRIALFALRRCRVRLRRESYGAPPAARLDAFLDVTAKVLASVCGALQGASPAKDTGQWLQELVEIAGEIRATEDASRPLLAETRFQMDALAGQLRAAVEVSSQASSPSGDGLAVRGQRAPWQQQFDTWAATLRANFSLDSSACRHGIRMAICIAIGESVAQTFAIPRSYWLGMTIALVLKPDFGNTFSRGALRLAGTYAGLLLATVLFHTFAPGVEVVCIGVLAFLQLTVGRANYGILVTVISALIVYLFSVSGVTPKDVIATRALNTTIGGALALVIYTIWPTREQTQAPLAFAQMLEDYRIYFQAVSRACLECRALAPHELDKLRANGRRARSNVETSVDRLGAEPYISHEELRLFHAMLASSHRFIRAVMAMEAGLASQKPPQEEFRVFAHDLEKVLYFLAARFRGSLVPPASLPDLREDHHRLLAAAESGQSSLLITETDRMTNGLNTLAGQVFRWAERRA
ncbi:MAG: FUSC family protein [Acidobacteria bacterium]|nr:FUSC family protein [Acidobacteriota bacterium]